MEWQSCFVIIFNVLMTYLIYGKFLKDQWEYDSLEIKRAFDDLDSAIKEAIARANDRNAS